jgi:alpha-galactosidase
MCWTCSGWPPARCRCPAAATACAVLRRPAHARVHAMTDPLTRSLWRRENRRGRTTQDCFPGAVVTTPGATERCRPGLRRPPGLVGQPASRPSSGCTTPSTSGSSANGWRRARCCWRPGRSCRRPELWPVVPPQGLNGLAANFHAALRQRINWPGGDAAAPGAPEHLGGFYFDLDPPR